MEYHGMLYVGSLLFDDSSGCQFAYEFFCEHRGSSIAEIGGVNVNVQSSEEKAAP